MEGPTKGVEDFGDFKNRIAETFKTEGLSDSLKEEIKRWCEKRYQETDVRGVTVTQKAIFQVELAKVYIVTYQDDLAYETLDDVLIIINNAIGVKTKELEFATTNPDSWISRVKKNREDSPDRVVKSIDIEIKKVEDDLTSLGSLLQEINNLYSS